MSYDQTFKGRFTFADAHCLEAGIDGFAAHARNSVVGLGDLKIRGNAVTVNVDSWAPASMFDATMSALHALGEHAASGAVKSTFVMDGTSRETASAGRRRTADGLPPRTRRWDLWRAATDGDAVALRKLARDGVAMNQTFAALQGITALHVAAKAGSADAVAALLAAGVDANATGTGSTVPLGVVCGGEAAKRLLDAGADPNGGAGEPLTAAIRRNDAGVARLLLAAGARVTGEDGALALACARSNQLDLLIALVERTPSIVPELADKAVIVAAIAGGNSVFVDYLLQHGATLPDDFATRAIEAGSPALVETALRAPEAIAACGPSNTPWCAMCQAAQENHLSVVELLAGRGVPVHPATPGDTSPLHCSVRHDRRETLAVVRWLLDHGAPATATTSAGRTALMEACTYSAHPPIVKLLLARGADRGDIARADMTKAKRTKLLAALGKTGTAKAKTPKTAKTAKTARAKRATKR